MLAKIPEVTSPSSLVDYLVPRFTYGYRNARNQLITDGDYMDFTTTPPDEFQTTLTGVCYDCVAYQHAYVSTYFPSVYINAYYAVAVDRDKDLPSHTWLTHAHHGSVVVDEVAWHDHAGVTEYQTETDMIVQYLRWLYHNDEPVLVVRYNPAALANKSLSIIDFQLQLLRDDATVFVFADDGVLQNVVNELNA